MGLLDRISFKASTSAPPESIDVTPAGELRILWPGGSDVTIPAFSLRDQCPCAGCIDEHTGKKTLDPATIPADIRPLEIRPVGNYAIQFQWSDGHGSGIYTWTLLRRLSGLDA
jgi:DUF971 family protein